MNLHITINDQALCVEKGISILQAARLNGIDIPTLCDYPGLPPSGSCRLCVVEIQGKPTTPTACTTPVEEGMVIQTHSKKIRSLRNELFQMLLAEHPACCFYCPEKNNCDDCMVTLRKVGVTTGCRSCPKDGQCSLQEMAGEIDIPQPDYPVRYRMLKVEKTDPFIDRDYNLCVLCGRCIRTCEQLHFSNAMVYTRRGAEAVVGTAFQRTHLEAGCSFCGACVEACPTGALSEKTRKWDGKPHSEKMTTCPLCSLGCQVRLLSTQGSVIGSLPDHSKDPGTLCVEGRFGFAELLNHPDRLTQPQKTVGEHRLTIEWDTAIQRAAGKLRACSPGRFQMILSPDLSNEDLYIAHKFASEVMGTAPQTSSAYPFSAEDWASFLLLLKDSQPLSVLDNADLIVSLGFDGRFAQSVVEVAIHRARVRGSALVTVNPFEHSLSLFADEWLRPKTGEAALHMIRTLAGMTGEVPTQEIKDRAFSQDEQLAHTARLLRGAKNPVILLGTEFLYQINIQEYLPSVQSLLDAAGARLVILLQEGNLAGALLFASLFPPSIQEKSSPKFKYLIGVDVPADCSGKSEIIYQNIFQPSTNQCVDLLLPAASFSETSGTTINHARRVAAYHQAVSAPGAALPHWEILCRIARQMDVGGFDFAGAEEIRAEIETQLPGFNAGEPVPWVQGAAELPVFSQMAFNPSLEHSYMGQPLQRRVAGLRDLYQAKNKEWAAYVHHS